ncbi:MAG: trigger factor [Candidatus Acidiferrales bacterium]
MATSPHPLRRELEVEIPLELVERETERVTREFARHARLPGFRPGKAPAGIIRQRFWDDIRSEVLRALVPASLERAFQEKRLMPVGEPSIADLRFEPDQPLRFKASFEVLPEIELKDYKGLEVEPAKIELTDEDVERELETLRERAATYEGVEGRAAEDGDTVVVSLVGIVTEPKEKREPLTLEDAVVHLGEENTLPAFNENLRGVTPGEEKRFSVAYPADYPQAHLAGRTVAFTAQVKEVRRKQLPPLDDDFARRTSDAPSLDELKAKLRAHLEEVREHRERNLTRDRLLEALLARHDFPVPEALVERQMDRRLERQVRSLAAQGIDPRRVDVDWRKAWRAGREAAERDTRLGLLLERVAEAEGIQTGQDDLDREVERMAGQARQTPEAVRARLTKEETWDSLKSAIRSEKVVEFLLTHARLTAPGR